MLLRERLVPAPKAPGSFDRSLPVSETLANESRFRARFGITRVAEITHLDRIGIPVFSAIVPDSPEAISVYNGKGITAEAARVGAIMEAVERQAAARLPLTRHAPGANGPVRIADLLDDERHISAADLAATLGPMRERIFSSNGLASGNTVTEAVYHALIEVIERHVWSVVHAIAHLRPSAVLSKLIGRNVTVPGLIDDEVAMELAPPTGSLLVDRLIAQIAAAGLHVVVRAVELRPFPPLLVATIVEGGTGISRFHCGFGCSLSPEHAALRAITEAAQGRAADMHAAREDYLGVDDPPSAEYGDGHRRRSAPPAGRWYYDAPAWRGSLADLRDDASHDIAADVATLIGILRRAGCPSALVIDCSPSDLPVSIVRAIVPGLEHAIVDGTTGATIEAIIDAGRYPSVLADIVHDTTERRAL